MLAGLERLARLTVAGKKSGLPRVIRPKEFGLLEKIENVFSNFCFNKGFELNDFFKFKRSLNILPKIEI
jgi:hypothetical protein